MRNSNDWHLNTVHPNYARTDTSLSFFIAQTSREYNFLPSSVFPLEYDVQSFKRQVNNLIVTDLKTCTRLSWLKDSGLPGSLVAILNSLPVFPLAKKNPCFPLCRRAGILIERSFQELCVSYRYVSKQSSRLSFLFKSIILASVPFKQYSNTHQNMVKTLYWRCWNIRKAFKFIPYFYFTGTYCVLDIK